MMVQQNRVNLTWQAIVTFISAYLLFTLACCTPSVSHQSEFALGTVCSVTLPDKARTEVFNAVFTRLHEIEDRFSVNKNGTEVDEINAKAGAEPVRVSADVLTVIEKSLSYAEISVGAFDPTIGPLVKLWGIGFDDPHIPSQTEIDAVLPLVNWQNVRIDSDGVFLTKSGMALDLGGIVKGYAADEAARILTANKVKRAVIDLGGNIFVFGRKKDGSSWRIGVQNPLSERGDSVGVVETVGNKTMVTSGVYERFFEVDGVSYHHILSTENGFPVRNGLLSVTVIADSSIDADALSTALFALGFEKGIALAESLDGVDALFIFEDKTIRGDQGAIECFSLVDNEWTILGR
ncbi:MAG: FAD:protein FMN transferase [Treponema sp.]|jgi:thiamine biosynthesis lipoprotein|nr:FAD:protein FMN transferase [Treponema sp.]